MNIGARIIQILDGTEEKFTVASGELVKLINPDGEDVGGFYFIGRPLVINFNSTGHVVLTDVPHEDKMVFVDVNHKGGQLIFVENQSSTGSFFLSHPKLSEKDSRFRPYSEVILSPQPFSISWNFYSTEEQVEKTVTIEFQPIPAEHALLMEYSIS